jgi:hypothetical protein
MDEVEVMKEGDAGKELSSEALYLSAWKGHESIALEEVEYALTKQVCDYTYVISEIE